MIKLKKILSLGVLTIGVMTLAACSSTRHAPSGGAMGSSTYEGSDVDNSVLNGQGLGGDASLTGVDGQTSLSVEQLLAIHTYHFAYDSAEILASDKPAVIAEAQYLAAHPNQHILLAGNTDSRGSREYNIALGWRRAQSVEDLMLLNGANKSQIQLVSYGEEKPVVFGDSDEAYQQNRRVDLSNAN
ncbi:MAG: OmpA family protein [Gammaproteobacteria bacterium]|nr:OmpA family protein [Gammaproteobacteria bacterium]MCD8542248.1 OmpA family protein [Gammaproteobacteria bacterium]